MAEKNEWLIGREAEDFKVGDKSVSRRHARLSRTDEGFVIEDLDSKGGVFVNGKAIARKLISPEDTVMLGSYRLNIKEIIDRLPISDADFERGFRAMESLYQAYLEKKVKIQSQSQTKMMLKRSLPMAVPGLLMVVTSLSVGGDSSALKTITTVVGGVLSAAAMVAGTVWGAKDMADMPARLAQVEENFRIHYSCPSCHNSFGQTPWESLRRQGKCPYCKRKFFQTT